MGNLLTPSSQQWDSSTVSNCNIYTNFRRNKNTSFLGISGYEGIPQNLVVNIFGWLTLHSMFIILRKKAWNYGRMAVMQKDEIKWTDMFYGGYNDEEDISLIGTRGPVTVIKDSDSLPEQTNQNPTITYGSEYTEAQFTNDNPSILEVISGSGVNSVNSTAVEGSSRQRDGNEKKTVGGENNASANNVVTDIWQPSNVGSQQHTISIQTHAQDINEIKDTGYFSWIKIVYSLTDEQYKEKCGQDCVFYMSFQRHLILLAAIISFTSLTIILPINLHNSFKRPDNITSEFTDTTIINLKDDYKFIWAHVVLAISYLFISIFVMRHFSKRLQISEQDDIEISRTISIVGISKENCQEEKLRTHFMESYHGVNISEISFAYDVAKLEKVEFQRLSACSAHLYFQAKLEKEEIQRSRKSSIPKRHSFQIHRPKMRPYTCGVCGCCCRPCGKCKKTDAIEYYKDLENKFTEEVDAERQRALNNPLGIAFVTFSTEEYAERVVDDYTFTSRIFLRTPTSKLTKELKSNRWMVKYAPPPEDINWRSLSVDIKMWYVKFVVVNLLLAVIVIICTTPVYVFTIFSGPGQLKGQIKKVRSSSSSPITKEFASLVLDTLPTAIIWILGVSLIALVARSDLIIGFWTKTAGNLSEMIKVFLFLVLMVIILPSVGVTSLSNIISVVTGERAVKWSCIFYKENGALFVNYICTSSLVGTAAELMRLPELFKYTMKLSFARSVAEVAAIRKSVLWEFQIGSSYAWMMLHFAMLTCFSVIYPLVTPFGLIYLCLKHWTDRYNIYFAYAPCKVNKNVHGTAVNMVIMCMFMLQINLLVYVHFHFETSIASEDPALTSIDDNIEIRALQIFSLLGFSITAALFLGQLCFNVCADFSPIHHIKSISTDDRKESNPVLEVFQPGSSKMSYEDMQQNNKHGYRLHREASTTEINSHAQIEARADPHSKAKVTRQIPAVEVSRNINISRTPSPARSWSQDFLRHLRSESRSSNGSTSGNRPYGRYIPPLLRPEFIRRRQHNHNL